MAQIFITSKDLCHCLKQNNFVTISLCFATLVITTITCEPPINNYLPPGAGNGSGSRPAPQYGPPESNQDQFDGFNSGRGQNRHNYDPSRGGPSGSPSAEYGTPGQVSQGFQGSFRGRQGENSPLSSQYSSPNHDGPNRARGGSNSGRGSLQIPETSYGTPSQGLVSVGQNGFNGKGVGSQGQGSRRQLGGSPSSAYGTPDFGKDSDNTNQNYRRSGVDEPSEPAKYEFSYEVDDIETGTMFGHSEQRDGDFTTGQYNVVLPDGRKQVVQYEANKDGYKPQIRYEGRGRGGADSGFGRGASGGNRGQGYPGAGITTDAFADAQLGNVPQGRRYQQPDFDQGSSGGYPSGRPDNKRDSFGDQGFSSGVGNGFLGGPGGTSFTDRSRDGSFPGGQASQGYTNGPQGGRGSPRRGGQGSNNGGSDEGYPSGGPSGSRGSGY